MNRLFTLVLPVLLAACSTTSTRPEDAGIDAAATPREDASVDAYTSPWALPDSRSDVFYPDAFMPDAFNIPGEGCNGLDDDFDGSIDEYVVCPEASYCIDGVCGCPAGTLSCTTDVYACEVTSVITREHCGGCTPCDPSEDCSTEGGAPHCIPARIVDFSAATETSGITCIIREQDNHVVCREGGRWVDFQLRAHSVRAWQGAVCAAGMDRGRVYCRGPHDTGFLFGEYDGSWWRLPVPISYHFELFSIEGGEGILGADDDATVWGGSRAWGRTRVLTNDTTYRIGDGRRRMVTATARGVVLPLQTWGAPVPALSSAPWTDSLGGAAERAVIRTIDAQVGPADAAVEEVWCYGDYCCAWFGTHDFSAPPVLQCWGGTGAEVELVPITPFGIPRLFPTPEGVRLCVEDRCMLAADLHGADPVLRVDPDALVGDVQARSDWRALCQRNHTTHGFDCIGMHSGWPIP